MVIDDPFLPLAFSLYSSPGAYAVLAGAGVSKGAGLKSAWEIVVDLIQQIAESGDEDPQNITPQTAGRWYEKRFGKTPEYSTVVEHLGLTPIARQALLRGYFEPGEAGEDGDLPTESSQAHRAIARLVQVGVINIIMTLNFDRLFEKALAELGIEPTIVATDADAQGLAALHTIKACVVHLHGDYLNPTSMLNTSDELSVYKPHMAELLEKVLSNYGLIAAGWSVQHDHALRDAVAGFYPPGRYTMGWVEPCDLTPAASELITAKRAVLLRDSAWCASRVCGAGPAQWPNGPLTISRAWVLRTR